MRGGEQSRGGSEDTPRGGPSTSRRGLLRGALIGTGGLVAGAAAGGATGWAVGSEPEPDTIDLGRKYPFYGEPHQGGIATPPQQHTVFASFRLADSAGPRDLQVLLARWSASIAVLQDGRTVGAVQPSSPVQPPRDTGEASGLSPAGLTVTLGLGPAVFGDRFGLARFRPARFTALPKLNGDTLDPALTGGDLSLQACADDPQVAYHAIRNLARIGRDAVVPYWSVLGFGRASAGPGQQTPRNLLGFKDGTRNVTTDEQYSRFVWLGREDQPWAEGGTYQVVRKIRMLLETWDTDRVGDQQQIIGRSKAEGAPLSGTTEFDTPDFAARTASGETAIDPKSHVALAAPEHNGGLMLHRRGYNYTDGLTADGSLDAGLLFVAYVNDPRNFVTLQNRLGANDLLNEYIRHIGSAIFLVPPAPAEGHYVGEALFT
ncbi:Dyp-type peroxidase [Pseudonocardia phyllosphaerae]|uniref:Dyp-type peroxidase n=1 Tax=Pseudonocardia phyllosphaerae TaxID=3390502 RepID=UPI00397E41DE